MVLRWVEIDGMNTLWLLQKVVEDVVSSTSDGQDDIVMVDLEELSVDLGILPVEGVDVFVSKLLMLLEKVVVIDSPVVLLVESRREREVGAQIDNSRFV